MNIDSGGYLFFMVQPLVAEKNFQKSSPKQTLKLDSHLPKKIFLFALMIALQNDKKCFLIYLKSSFCS